MVASIPRPRRGWWRRVRMSWWLAQLSMKATNRWLRLFNASALAYNRRNACRKRMGDASMAEQQVALSAAPAAMTGPRGLRWIVGMMVFAAVITVAYWVIWFGIDR